MFSHILMWSNLSCLSSPIFLRNFVLVFVGGWVCVNLSWIQFQKLFPWIFYPSFDTKSFGAPPVPSGVYTFVVVSEGFVACFSSTPPQFSPLLDCPPCFWLNCIGLVFAPIWLSVGTSLKKSTLLPPLMPSSQHFHTLLGSSYTLLKSGLLVIDTHQCEKA